MQLSRRSFLEKSAGAGLGVATSALLGQSPLQAGNATANRPNILYIIMEDIGPQLSCYGEPLVQTPHVDKLAAQGIRFTSAYCAAPVCSAARSSIMTGCYQTLLGAHNHRTYAYEKRTLPMGRRHISQWFRDAGYYTCNIQPPNAKAATGNPRDLMHGAAGSGKVDLNFYLNTPDKNDFFDGMDWNQRAPGQPFFAHITIIETHKGEGWKIAREQPASELVDSTKVKLASFYPDSPIARDEYANYLDAIHLSDGYVGQLLARLEKDGLAENTIVVLSSDHGQCLFRSKQFVYDGGLHIPLIIKFPDGMGAGTVNDDFVSGIDMAPTMLGMAGVKPPAGAMQGRDFLAHDTKPREYIFAARDRMDIAMDRMRAIRTRQYKYILNYLPTIAYMQTNPYKERQYPTWDLVKEWNKEGKLNATQALFAAPEKPIEELYDLHADPDEVHNLANDSAHKEVLEQLRALVAGFVKENDALVTYENPLEIYKAFWGSLPEDTSGHPIKRQQEDIA